MLEASQTHCHSDSRRAEICGHGPSADYTATLAMALGLLLTR